MGSKGGSENTTSTVELPPEIEQAAIDNLRIADEVSAIGYTPYQGATLAAFNPSQMSAMQSFDNAASAFGMPSAMGGGGGGKGGGRGMSQQDMYTALTGMQPPNAAGGHSPYPMYQDAVNQMAPGQKAAIDSFVMDPVTGAPPTNRSIPAPQTQYMQLPDGSVVPVPPELAEPEAPAPYEPPADPFAPWYENER